MMTHLTPLDLNWNLPHWVFINKLGQLELNVNYMDNVDFEAMKAAVLINNIECATDKEPLRAIIVKSRKVSIYLLTTRGEEWHILNY